MAVWPPGASRATVHPFSVPFEKVQQENDMSEQSRTRDDAAMTRSPSRAVGVWMAVFLIAGTAFNAVQAIWDPVEFASRFGVPVAPDTTAFVSVYAIRALFLGVFAGALVWRRDFRSLALFVLVAVIMPLGDAALVAYQAGPLITVVRHLLIAVFLLATAFLLRRWMHGPAMKYRLHHKA